jgi:hypothetical protein
MPDRIYVTYTPTIAPGGTTPRNLNLPAPLPAGSGGLLGTLMQEHGF